MRTTKKKKILVRNPEKVIPNMKLFHNDNSIQRVSLPEWTLPSNKDFPDFLKRFDDATRSQERQPLKLWNSNEQKYADIGAYSHQKFVSDFMNDNSPYRGLLLYHGLGSGKSGASIMITEGFKNRRVVIMLPASLRNNYERELATFADIGYKQNYNWKFVDLSTVPDDKMDLVRDMLVKKGLDASVFVNIMHHNNVKSYKKGIWMIKYDDSEPNFDSLDEKSQAQLLDQIKIMYNFRFTILNYNSGQYTITNIFEKLTPNYPAIHLKLFGSKKKSQLTNKDRTALLNYVYNSENGVSNPFDNKVLVIDEIHNLTASMVGGGFNGPKLYELIMRSKNLKIVLLSGTPVINYAFEIGLMMNMLRGLIRSYRINLKHPNGIFNAAQIENILKSTPHVDRFKLNIRNKSIDITRTPIGFIKSPSGNRKVVKSDLNNDPSDQYFVGVIIQELSKLGYQQNGEFDISYYSMFPDLLVNRTSSESMIGNSNERDINKELFNNFYIDTENFLLKNTITFKNRITGLVSFYNEISGKDEATGADIFPELEFAEEKDTHAYMSNFQFIEYAAKRKIERELEQINKRRGGVNQKAMIESVTENVPNLFRVFSRQKGLFVFPPTIERPMPPKKDEVIKDSLITSVGKETVNRITEQLKVIFELEVSKRQDELEKYLGALSSKESSVADELVGKLFSNNPGEFKDKETWLKSYKFNDSNALNLDVNVTSDESEQTYRDICIQAIEQLTENNLTIDGDGINLMDLSPKYALMLTNMHNTPGLIFGYSQFRSVEGIEIYARILIRHGYSQLITTLRGKEVEIEKDISIEVGSRVRYEVSKDTWRTYLVEEIEGSSVRLEGIADLVETDKVHRACFALWTGTESVEERSKILDIYRGLSNKFGQDCLMLFTTQSGAEGISLAYVRQVHIMEPYWNNVRIEQVIGRARRIKSHVLLPEDQRNVKVFQYIIKLTDAQKSGLWVSDMDESELKLIQESKDSGFDADEYPETAEISTAFEIYAQKLSTEITQNDEGLSSDEVLAEISKNKKRILDGFLTLMKESAVDCNFNKRDNIMSNRELESLKCNDIIIGEGDVTYDIWIDELDSRTASSATESEKIKKIKTKKLIMTQQIKGKPIKTFLNLPPELSDITVSEAIRQLPVGHKIYDYYIYYDLYHKERSGGFKSLFKVGEIINQEGQNKISFSKSFVERINDYGEIHDCMVEKEREGITMPESGEFEIIRYASEIKECHKKKEKWVCQFCDELVTGPECVDCSVSRAESESYQVKSTQTTTSTKTRITLLDFESDDESASDDEDDSSSESGSGSDSDSGSGSGSGSGSDSGSGSGSGSD